MLSGSTPSFSFGRGEILGVLISHRTRRSSRYLNLLLLRRSKREGEVACKKRHGGVDELHGDKMRVERCYWHFRVSIFFMSCAEMGRGT